MIYNQFFFPWKVPSMNDLNEFRAIQGPQRGGWLLRKAGKKKPNSFRYNKYNEIKQLWSKRVSDFVTKKKFAKIDACYFNYLVVEKERRRDPSNICSAAIKFVEDGLQTAGVIPNDGWDNVLCINPQWVLHRKCEHSGLFLVMSSYILEFNHLCEMYLMETNVSKFKIETTKREIISA